ncbi:hypothetical protein MPSEU_000917400 [Mayamaea pseudoterrestris]|nr:hypothetical protein MPSEU_000917400 [Mayamaea pseudoterrestris]
MAAHHPSSLLAECFTETDRLRSMLGPDISPSFFELECEFKGDRQRLLQAGSLLDLESFIDAAVAVWMSPSVMVMTSDCRLRALRHFKGSFLPDRVACTMVITTTIRMSSNSIHSPSFMLHWDGHGILNESIQYVMELFMAMTHNLNVELLSVFAVHEIFLKTAAEKSGEVIEPFDAMALDDFLSRHKETLLTVDLTSCLLSDASCRVLGTFCGEVKFFDCALVNVGALGSSMANGAGPKQVAIHLKSTQELSLLENLPVNNQIESLELGYIYEPSANEAQDVPAHVPLIKKCRALKRLSWFFFETSCEAWDVLMQSLQSHLSLTTFTIMDQEWDAVKDSKRRTMSVVQCLQKNQSIESFSMTWYDFDIWETMVEPLLQVNAFRKRMRSVIATPNENLGRANLGKILHKVKHNRNLIRCCLEDNFDLLLTY